MYTRIVLSAIALFTITTAFSQNAVDALRYSQLDVTGTARYASMGGAFGALGGDMTTLSVNPAGIGVFTKTEAAITIGILSSATEATYLGTTANNSRMNFNIGNAGFVARFNRKKGEEKQWAWKAFHIGVAYNRTGSFNGRATVNGVNTSSSMIDSWVNQLNTAAPEYTSIPITGIQPGGAFTDAHMGWGTYMVDTVPGNSNQYLRNVIPFYGQTQTMTEVSRGSMSEVALSFGGNFGNALYFGATIGIPSVSYEVERKYTESDSQDTIANFKSFTKTDNLKASGNGFNVKFGLIYRPVKWLRIGAAIHTPTFFEMDEAYSSSMVSEAFGAQFTSSSDQGVFDYSLETPFRAIGSLAFVVGNYGLVSADYEFVDYSMARLRSNVYGFDAENAAVQNTLSWAGNIRVGTEWRLDKVSFRGGFAINGNPYTGAYSFDDTRYSLGVGLRLNRWSLDLAYLLHRRAGVYELYDTALTPLAEAVQMNHNVMFSTAFRF